MIASEMTLDQTGLQSDLVAAHMPRSKAEVNTCLSRDSDVGGCHRPNREYGVEETIDLQDSRVGIAFNKEEGGCLQ